MLEDPIILKIISSYVLQTFLAVYQKHPQWLSEKYRRYPWYEQDFEVKFTRKL